ncbi:MAG: riboflavin synthase [Halanaerobiales bacterium]
MFTGIVQEIGILKKRIKANNRYQLIIEAARILGDVSKGDSIAVNGVCLTVVSYTDNTFTADVMPETLRATNLSKLNIGAGVNLEQAVRADGFYGGHLVTGHVDGSGIVSSINLENNAHLVEIKTAEELTNYMVDKGSIALNGVSLTIMKVSTDSVSVSLIPETWSSTNLSNLNIGDEINIETDLIGKYVYKMLGKDRNNKNYSSKKSNIDKKFLLENGFL